MNPLLVAPLAAAMKDLTPEKIEKEAKRNKIILTERTFGCSLCRRITGTTLHKLPDKKGYVCQACFDRVKKRILDRNEKQ